MHLTCRKHGRRSVVLPSGTIAHRSDPGSCNDNWVQIGARLLSGQEVVQEKELEGRLRKIEAESTTVTKKKRKS